MDYQTEQNILYTKKIQQKFEELPDYCANFILSKTNSTSIRTRYGMCMDIAIFLEFIAKENGYENAKEVLESDLQLVTAHDIDKFSNYLKCYERKGVVRQNSASGIKRKIASIKTFYKYLIRENIVTKNPASLVDSPVVHDKEIIKISNADIKKMKAGIMNGNGMSRRQKKLNMKNILRDKAIMMLLLNTGIRISECVGLDLKDIRFIEEGENRSYIVVTRKGGDRDRIYISDIMASILKDYLSNNPDLARYGTRRSYNPQNETEALFLSCRHERMTVRAIEIMIKKYATLNIEYGEQISPHKFRSTYASLLYEKSKDLNLVAQVLGHRNISMAQKRYVRFNESEKIRGVMELGKTE